MEKTSLIPFVQSVSINDAIEQQDVSAVRALLLYGSYNPIHLHGLLRKAVTMHVWSSSLNAIVDLLMQHGASPFFDPFYGHGGPCTFLIAINNGNIDLISKFSIYAMQSGIDVEMIYVIRYLQEKERYEDIDRIYKIISNHGGPSVVKQYIEDIQHTSKSLPLEFALLDIS